MTTIVFLQVFFPSLTSIYIWSNEQPSPRQKRPWTHRSISQIFQPCFTEQTLKFPAGAGAGTQVNCPVSRTIPAHLWVHHTSSSLVELSRFRSLQYNCLCIAHVASLKKKKSLIVILEPQPGIHILQMVEKLRDLIWSLFPLMLMSTVSSSGIFY